MPVHQRLEEVVRSFGTGVTEGYDPTCGYWGLYLGHLQKLASAFIQQSISPIVIFLHIVRF